LLHFGARNANAKGLEEISFLRSVWDRKMSGRPRVERLIWCWNTDTDRPEPRALKLHIKVAFMIGLLLAKSTITC